MRFNENSDFGYLLHLLCNQIPPALMDLTLSYDFEGVGINRIPVWRTKWGVLFCEQSKIRV